MLENVCGDCSRMEREGSDERMKSESRRSKIHLEEKVKLTRKTESFQDPLPPSNPKHLLHRAPQTAAVNLPGPVIANIKTSSDRTAIGGTYRASKHTEILAGG
jgi:hypothetical protein